MTSEEFINKYGRQLNDSQINAVQSVDGPILLLAVPGSGKTTVLVNRLGYMLLVKNIKPKNILTLTYTVAATKDMSRRFISIFGEEMSTNLEFRTINGICAKILADYSRSIGKEPPTLITDEGRISKIITDTIYHETGEYPTESDVKGIRSLITYCKNMLLNKEEIEKLEKNIDLPLSKVYETYNAFLKSNHSMDYDDQMIYAYKLLVQKKELLDKYKSIYTYICVDEAQDTSKIQHLIIALLAGNNGNLFMVGDEDQSIYGFRAAYPEALLNFEKDHKNAKVLVMDKNYRSNANIVSVADNFIQNNTKRHEKHIVATREATSEVRFIDLAVRKAQYSYLFKVAKEHNRQTAVLYRDNENILPLIDLLEREHIPYTMKGNDMTFFTHRVVKDIENFLFFALDPMNTDLFMQIYFKCNMYLKKKDALRLAELSKDKGVPVYDAGKRDSSYSAMCNKLAHNIKYIRRNTPLRAINYIMDEMEYEEYLNRSGISANKVYILKVIAAREETIEDFLNRLLELREITKETKMEADKSFILSTIHSSKGLEYDDVYLIDVCDGVFPANSLDKHDEESVKAYEEERRLFYVGMTRARENLNIFKCQDEYSSFLSEAGANKKSSRAIPKQIYRRERYDLPDKNAPSSVSVGDQVVHSTFGEGKVISIDMDDSNIFRVRFENDGKVRMFSFSSAFSGHLRMLD